MIVTLCHALCHALLLLHDKNGVYSIHDWTDYAGKLTTKREANREQQRRHRKSKDAGKPVNDDVGCNAYVTRDVTRDVTVMSPYSTVQYSTNKRRRRRRACVRE